MRTMRTIAVLNMKGGVLINQWHRSVPVVQAEQVLRAMPVTGLGPLPLWPCVRWML